MTYAVIVAAGIGSRMGGGENKQLIKLEGIEVIARTLRKFEEASLVNKIIVVASEELIDKILLCSNENNISKLESVIPGGAERQESVYNGLMLVPRGAKVLIHDGARPFVNPNKINELVLALDKYRGAALGVKVKDTVKRIDECSFVSETVCRDDLILIQTPQAFWAEDIKSAHINARNKGIRVTDDCALMERENYMVKIVDGEYTNLKITTPEDLIFAEGILKCE